MFLSLPSLLLVLALGQAATASDDFTVFSQATFVGSNVHKDWAEATATDCHKTQSLLIYGYKRGGIGTGGEIPVPDKLDDGLSFLCGDACDDFPYYDDQELAFMLDRTKPDNYVKFVFEHGTTGFLVDIVVNGAIVVDVYCNGEKVDEIAPEEGFQYDNNWAFTSKVPCHEVMFKGGRDLPGPGSSTVEVLFVKMEYECQVELAGAKTYGDPHFQRWAHQQRNSFHGECDLVLLHQPTTPVNEDELQEEVDGVDVHIRTTIRNSYSFIEAAAMQVGADVVEFNPNGVYVNSRMLTDGKDFPFRLSDGRRIVHMPPKSVKGRRVYHVYLNDETSIVVKFSKTLKFVTVSVQGTKGLENSVGLLGQFDTGAMQLRDGSILEESTSNFHDFAMQWQVQPGDVQLFADARAPQWPQTCRMPGHSEADALRRRLRVQGSRELMEMAEAACKQYQPDSLDLCIKDVMLTGDLELAEP